MDSGSQSPPAGAGGEATKYVALPFQLIERDAGVILRRGRVQVMIGGHRALETVQTLVEAMSGGGATIADVCNLFAAPDHPGLVALIEQLSTRKFLVPAGSEMVPIDREGHLDVFYWHVGVSTGEINRRLNQVRIAIAGVNHISNQLVRSLIAAGTTNFEVIDYPLLRNLSLFSDAGNLQRPDWSADKGPVAYVAYDEWAARVNADSFDCLVATSDFGGRRSMERWNALCLDLNRHFLPVMLQDLVGYIGPLVIPGETACFECYTARLASNRGGEDIDLPSESAAFEGLQVAGFHPSMPWALGNIAALELTKFYSRALPFWKVGTVTEVNLLAGRMDSRKVSRVPRCRACSTLIRRSSASMVKGTHAGMVTEE